MVVDILYDRNLVYFIISRINEDLIHRKYSFSLVTDGFFITISIIEHISRKNRVIMKRKEHWILQGAIFIQVSILASSIKAPAQTMHCLKMQHVFIKMDHAPMTTRFLVYFRFGNPS